MNNAYNYLVTIIIPVYNTYRFLGACIESVRSQTYKNLEIICVNDGSTDNSQTILDFYSANDKRIKCLKQKNQGPSVTRNTGLKNASGKYICFVDSDDIIMPDAVEQCIKTIEEHKVDVVLFNMECFFPDGTNWLAFNSNLHIPKNPLFSSTDEISVNFTNAVVGMYKADIFEDSNIGFPVGMFYEDWVFMVRLMTSRNLKLFFLNEPFYKYRRDFDTTITTTIAPKTFDLFTAYEKAKEIIRAHEDRRNQIFINDLKIMNESIGLFLSKIIYSENDEIICTWTEKIISILKTFPKAYIFFLYSYMRQEYIEFCKELCNLVLRKYDKKDILYICKKYIPNETKIQKAKKAIKKMLKIILTPVRPFVRVLKVFCRYFYRFVKWC